MLCGAAGFKEYLYLLSSIYNNIGKNFDYNTTILASRKLSQINKCFSYGEKIKILKSKNDMSTHDPAKFQFDGDLSNPFIEARNVLQEVFIKLKEYAKNHNATINDIVLTAYIRTLYQTFGHVIAVPCAVDLRKYLPNHKDSPYLQLAISTYDNSHTLSINLFGSQDDRNKISVFLDNVVESCIG